MSDLMVQISGTQLSGKSTVAQLIASALAEAGIDALVIDDNGVGVQENRPGAVAGTLDARLASLRHRAIEVSVRTVLSSNQD